MDLHYASQFEDVNEDDVFYVELRRQILLLTADQDEDHENFVHRKHPNSISTLQPESYFNWWGSTKPDSIPNCLVNLWRNGNGNGTGVFIPHIVRTMRHKAGRNKKERSVQAGGKLDIKPSRHQKSERLST